MEIAVHKSDKLSLDQLALVEALGIGEHAVMRSALHAGEDVLVVGAGLVGLSVVQFASAAGGRVRMRESSPARREFVAPLGVETLTAPDALPGLRGSSARLGGARRSALPSPRSDPFAPRKTARTISHASSV